MKTVLAIIAVILVISFAAFLLPAIIGIAIGIGLFKSGSIIGGIVVILIGIGTNIAMVYNELIWHLSTLSILKLNQ